MSSSLTRGQTCKKNKKAVANEAPLFLNFYFAMLEQLEKAYKALSEFDLAEEQLKVIEAHKEDLADIQAAQWAQSKDGEGEELRLLDNPEYDYGYTPFTKDMKAQYGVGLGAIYDRVTLFGQGTMYKSLFVTITRGYFIINSPLEYFNELMYRTGQTEVSLNYESRLHFAENFVIPGVKKALREKTGLVL